MASLSLSLSLPRFYGESLLLNMYLYFCPSVSPLCLSLTRSLPHPAIDLSRPRYCLSGLPVDCQMKNLTSPDQTSLLLEDLIIWTNYEIEVAAYNGAGRGTYSHKVTEWTLQGGEGQRSLI